MDRLAIVLSAAHPLGRPYLFIRFSTIVWTLKFSVATTAAVCALSTGLLGNAVHVLTYVLPVEEGHVSK